MRDIPLHINRLRQILLLCVMMAMACSCENELSISQWTWLCHHACRAEFRGPSLCMKLQAFDR